jgi:hypothetical protein
VKIQHFGQPGVILADERRIVMQEDGKSRSLPMNFPLTVPNVCGMAEPKHITQVRTLAPARIAALVVIGISAAGLSTFSLPRAATYWCAVR